MQDGILYWMSQLHTYWRSRWNTEGTPSLLHRILLGSHMCREKYRWQRGWAIRCSEPGTSYASIFRVLSLVVSVVNIVLVSHLLFVLNMQFCQHFIPDTYVTPVVPSVITNIASVSAVSVVMPLPMLLVCQLLVLCRHYQCWCVSC